MDRIPDILDLWEAQDIEKEQWLARLPKCECCLEPIQDEHYFDIDGVYYDIDGVYYCEDCLNDLFRKENYLED